MLPLQGIVVIAVEQAVDAPFCSSRLADAGARVIEGAKVSDLIRDASGRVNGVHIREEKSLGEVRARLIVGADGLGSIVARRAGLTRRFRWPRRIDRTLSWLVVTPRMHWNHHSPTQGFTNSNYGVILSCWDRAFATLTMPPAAPAEFGLRALEAPSWHSAFGMLATPWRARVLRQL